MRGGGCGCKVALPLIENGRGVVDGGAGGLTAPPGAHTVHG